ncbi:hypothetical protein [Halarchaeum sp. P4]|uniref:hypothetical protein n=1 Tax=Halarchaeum sp. P4 TaxID=3421639 RepID=UPI003EBC828F
MHGESSVKVPNGKLVRASVTYEAHVQSVEIRGDFFLEPPEALAALERAVEGLPRDAPHEEFAQAVDAVEATLVGFDADDVATAVREAMA